MIPVCRSLAVVALLGAPGAPAAARAATGHDMPTAPATSNAAAMVPGEAPVLVGMKGKIFAPGTADALVGEPVTWVNDDGTAHDVATFADGFDSGRMEVGARFSQTFAAQGTYQYHCTLHRFMFGSVRVFGLALGAATRSAGPGQPATLTGRAPVGVDAVTIERLGAAGAWEAVGGAVPGADRRFSAQVPTAGPSAFRARSGELLSTVVRIAARPLVHVSATRHGARIAITVATDPAQPGARVALQRYVRERFTFVTVARETLTRASRATFSLRSRHYERVRAVITQGVRGYGSATSMAVGVPTRPRTHGHR
jgi:plastocyanin